VIIKPDLDDDLNVGRLGNKLFIIAAMIGYAEQHNDTFMLPHWKYEKHFPLLPVHDSVPTSTFSFKEEGFHYQKLPYFKDTIMDIQGYFQSWKYFKEAELEVRHFFTPSENVCNQMVEYLKENELTNKYKCSLQVRRGDYVTNLAGCFHICTEEYYKDAMKKIPCDNYMVFSDDIPWCKSVFKGKQFHFVETGFNVVDLFLQAHCNDHIIGNSSFGWWGAWLNNSIEKRVIAPKTWFGPKLLPTHTDKDLIPTTWRCI
jgi:hypothetical protein